MFKTKLFVLWLLLTGFFPVAIFAADVPTPNGDGRQELIDRELNVAARRIESQSAAQLEPVSNESIDEPSKDTDEQAVGESKPDVQTLQTAVEQEKLTENKIDRQRLKKIELALQFASYNYKTDDNSPYYYSLVYDASNRVEKSGHLYGFEASYTYRKKTAFPIHSIKELFEEGNPGFTFARLEGELSFGRVDYHSHVTGKLNNFPAWQGNIKAIAGYDFLSLDESFMVTPYAGIGYKKVTDDAGGWVDISLHDHARYKNIYQFIYMPFGIETLKQINRDWDVLYNLEGSLMLYGNAQFSLHEIPGLFPGYDVSTGDPIETYFNDSPKLKFKRGFGIKTSLKAIKKFDYFNIFLEPFFEAWRISKSDEKVNLSFATNGKNYHSAYPDGSEYKPLYEPANYSVRLGLRLGVQF